MVMAKVGTDAKFLQADKGKVITDPLSFPGGVPTTLPSNIRSPAVKKSPYCVRIFSTFPSCPLHHLTPALTYSPEPTI